MSQSQLVVRRSTRHQGCVFAVHKAGGLERQSERSTSATLIISPQFFRQQMIDPMQIQTSGGPKPYNKSNDTRLPRKIGGVQRATPLGVYADQILTTGGRDFSV